MAEAVRFSHFERHGLSEADVAGLAALVAPAQQDDDGVPAPREREAVSRAMVDPDLADATADRLTLPGLSPAQGTAARGRPVAPAPRGRGDERWVSR